ncbi:hypothetical protein [Xanthomonas arboricola]|uniref:hypothetical protein n=1 Tax=Xanthomonas arboricola TaxID=56448 RepID=UPI0012DB1FAE|nr:hypothetical protein [Xanthomonas arboricola]
MAALSKITKASVVSSLSSAQAGRLYTETVGALFTVANSNRAFLEIEHKALGSQEWREFALATVALQNSEILPLLQATLATAREDLDMGQGDTDSFRAAIAPDWRAAQLKIDTFWKQFPLGKVIDPPQVLPRN